MVYVRSSAGSDEDADKEGVDCHSEGDGGGRQMDVDEFWCSVSEQHHTDQQYFHHNDLI